MASEKIVTESALTALASDAKRAIYDVLPGGSASGNLCTFDTDIAVPLQSVIVDIEATGGNGTPDNPNPIVGYSSANITRCGVNLFDIPSWLDSISTHYTVDNGVYTFQTSIRLNTPFVFSDTDKPTTVSVKSFGGTAAGQRVQLLNSSDTVVATADKVHLTVTATASKVRLDYGLGGSYILDNCIVYDNATGNTYTIAFGQTVYGGQLDVTRGKLHVTHYGVEYDGTENGWSWYGDYQQASIALPYPAKYEIDNITYKCNRLTPVLNQSRPQNVGNYASLISSGASGAFSTPETSLANFKTWLGSHHVQFVYELATPFDIDLTPQVIEAIVGENNVFADCGQSTVEYRKSVEKYVTEHGGGASWTDVVGTLTAGNTSITLSDASITTNSTIDYYPKSEYYGINPVGVSVRTGSVTLTFEAQDIDLDVKVRVS